jgi:hypothetical protein
MKSRPRRPYTKRFFASFFQKRSPLLTFLCLLAPLKAQGSPTCVLGPHGAITHVLFLEFDNVHLRRDDPNVASDLEQMPHLLDVLEQGAVEANNHTVIISHTAYGFLSAMTGLYADQLGVGVTNSFRYYRPNGGTASAPDFVYWTDKVAPPPHRPPVDTAPTLVDAAGANAPAPWVAFTRAGCDVGAVGMNGLVPERVPPGSRDTPASLVGLALHCARDSRLCAEGVPDVLPDEPGGYTGYRALLGAGTMNAALGGIPPFPGFGHMTPDVSLSYAATLFERGVPVVFDYVSDAHDNHAARGTFGPGSAGYQAQLRAYDAGFAAFFARLAKDGITTANTLFVVTQDEGDHFVGAAPTPAGCDGVHTDCTYAHLGEIDADLSRLLATERGDTTKFQVYPDSAPDFYVDGNPAADAPRLRQLEHDVGALSVTDPDTGRTTKLAAAFADRTTLAALHMISGDPLRTPSFIMFGDDDFWSKSTGSTASCAGDAMANCVFENPAYAWNHGDLQAPIRTTFLAFAGPGVKHLGIDRTTWSDHVDARPTMMALLGLHDDYRSEGSALAEVLAPAAIPPGIAPEVGRFEALAAAYKQIDAPFGAFGMAAIRASTGGILGDDASYAHERAALADLVAARDSLAASMATLLDAATFDDKPLPPAEADADIAQANALVRKMNALASAYPGGALD